MAVVETKILREDWDVDRRLDEMKLSRAKLLEIRDIAISAASNATANHAANAAGTFAYQDGTWALRDRFAGDDWVLDRSESVESIKNEKLKIIVVFSNVDMACNESQKPKPRSRKGAGAERLCSGNDLFGGGLPEFAPLPMDEYATYYLMVDEDGACELTRPVLKGGTFNAYIERIYLSDGSDLQGDDLSFDDDDDVVDDFDPLVIRK